MAEKKSKKNQKYFVDAWLEDPLFDGWLCKVKECNAQAHCSVCHKTIKLSSGGCSLITDLKGKKRKEAKKFFLKQHRLNKQLVIMKK